MTQHGKPCPYCGTIMRVDASKNAQNKPYFPTRDHVIPKSIMPGQPRHIVCKKCNNDKDNRTLEEWFEVLKSRCDPRTKLIKSHLETLRYD